MTSIAADTPIKDPSQDRFNRWPFARRIAQTIVSRSDSNSIVIGIYGSWGDGKTTVLNFIEEELKQHKNTICLKFNPWRFPDETKMLLSFYHSLAQVIGRSELTNKEKVGELIGKYLPTVASVFGQGETAENLSKLLSSVEIEEMKSRMNEMLKSSDKKIVVLIDDIDRLDKGEIQTLFRLVKLNADFVNTTYVLAFDGEMVAAALQEKYSSAGTESGRNFLEKIIQVPLDLPSIPTNSLRNFCFSKVDEAINDAGVVLTNEEEQAFVRGYIDGLEIRVKTPRIVTRYSNILSFSLPILKGEVNPVDVMLIEGIRLFYPRLYETIKNYPDNFLGKNLASYNGNSNEKEKQRTRDLIESGLSDYNADEKQKALSLLQSLFPRLKGVYGNVVYGPDWDKTWAKSKQIASLDYFYRFFSYSIIETDVSDTAIEKFLSSLEEKPEKEAPNNFISLLKSKNIEKVISKLRQRSDKISIKSSMVLSIVIASMGDIFPNPNQVFSFRGPYSQAAMLISDLMLNIPIKEKRFDFAKQILGVADPLPFAVEINRWFREEKESSNPNGFSTDEIASLRTFTASRIKESCMSKNIFLEFPKDASMLLSTWSAWANEQEVSSYLESLLDDDPSQVNLLIDGSVPTAWAMDTGIGSKGDLDRDIYNRISKIINPDKVLEAYTKVYNENLLKDDYPYSYLGEDTNLRLAQQFAWIHKKVADEVKNDNKEPEEESD